LPGGFDFTSQRPREAEIWVTSSSYSAAVRCGKYSVSFVQVADAVVEPVAHLVAMHLDHPTEPGDGDRRRLAVVVLEPKSVEDRIDVRVNAHGRRRVSGRWFGQRER